MKVFKFGGASIKNAQSVKNLGPLLAAYAPKQLVVVVSAMGKTTNTLEKILHSWYNRDEHVAELVRENENFHCRILSELFPDRHCSVYAKIDHYFQQIQNAVSKEPSANIDFEYDQLVCFGELISTTIIAEYLQQEGFYCDWMDARDLIVTDQTWREGNVNWEKTSQNIRKNISARFSQNGKQQIILTQGFLGGTDDGHTTTLGREGSDYTAAIFSYVLNVEEMIVWKDVPGVLNADPKIFSDTVLLKNIDYGEAIELTYYGATVIHPKTIKPLQNSKIPLRVRSFIEPDSVGTLISEAAEAEHKTPSYIVKDNQMMISFFPKDFSFIAEQNLSNIFAAFATLGIRVNMMQNSAVSFTACVTQNERKIASLFKLLEHDFKIKYNDGLQLITIRHWTPEIFEKMITGKEILLEQRNRTTAQIVFVKQ